MSARSLLLKLFAASLLLPPLAAAARGARPQDCGLPTQPRKFDEYGDVSADEERSRLEKLAAALDAEPGGTKAFIIAYAGRDGRAGDALRRADRARWVLTGRTNTSFLYNPRINTLDCGRRESPATEIWIAPAGAAPPRCSPTLDPAPAPARGGAARRTPRRQSRRP